MAHVLGQNQYGKAENRIVRVYRDSTRHEIKDLNVSVALQGDFEDVHLTGSNANCLPTDTTKNTVYAFAKEYGIESAEAFGITLARHFVDDTERGVVHSAGSGSRSTPGTGSRPRTTPRASSARRRSATPSYATAARSAPARSSTTARASR